MALQIIVKGKVVRDLTDPSLIILITEGRAGHWILPEWARPYIGKTLVISLEEEEKELEPIVSARLQRVLAKA